MKKLFYLLLLLPVFAFQCQKEDNSNCVKGKIVRITCATTVIQVLNNDGIGIDGWSDSHENIGTYDNVFTVSNKCQLTGVNVGDVVYFDLEPATQSDCVVCAMYDAPPSAVFNVKNLSTAACD